MRTLLWIFLLSAPVALAAEWYVAPEGAKGNPGTRELPWDLESALLGQHTVAPGDSICLTAGTYKRRPKELFEVKLKGDAEKPVVVRPADYNQRAIVDGGLSILEGSEYVWVRDLEILVSEPNPEEPVEPGSHPESFTRPWGGLHCMGGKNCKYINLVIHDTRQSISCWTPETDCEIYGCILYDNGWKGKDRGHGHCIYTQNNNGVKTIRRNIMSAKYDGALTIQAYGSSKAFVKNYLIEENIGYERGRLLVGGGSPSSGIKVFKNYLSDIDLQLGYGAENEDCEVRDNYIANGGLSIQKFANAVNENNTVISKDAKKPEENKIVVLKNAYDAGRAYVAVYNWKGATEAKIETGDLFAAGDDYEVRDPRAVFEKPLHTGKAEAGSVTIPLNGKFQVFVLVNPGAKHPY